MESWAGRAVRWHRRGARERVVGMLGVAPWVVIAVLSAVALPRFGAETALPAAVTTASLALVVTCLLARLLLVSVCERHRRSATIAFGSFLLLWAAGSLQVSAHTGVATAETFPAPGEWLFLAGYAALAAYLVFDVAPRRRPSPADWLDAAVASGGSACLVALLVVTPLAATFDRQGLPLLVALVYPVLDGVLLAVVLSQLALGTRTVGASSALLVAGLALLTAADTCGSFLYLGAGTYSVGALPVLCWGLAFAAMTAAVCRARPEAPAQDDGAHRGRATVAAAGVALGVLALQPAGGARPYLVVPAVLTCLAAGARLVVALREARGAAEAYRLSRTDDLTGLPNRRAVLAELADRTSSGPPPALALLDLDGFKEINDSLGHASGDALLRVLARRLRHAAPDDVHVARLGSDEFALVAPWSDTAAVRDLAEDLRRLVRRPIQIDGLEVSVGVSVGIAGPDAEVATRGDLLRRADVALGHAKRSGAGTTVYDPEQDEFSRARLALADDLRRGLERGEIVAWYQPQVDLGTGEVCSVEALVRWRHPRQGLIAPIAFLPVARRAGLMPRLTEVVLEAAMRDLARWLVAGIDICVAVNVSPPELLGGTVLPELGAILRRRGVPADRLIVEVTEDSFLAEPEHARRVLHELRTQGIQVSIDDYGTGFSSLAYLRDLPLQELKIDRSFVVDILTDGRSRMIVDTTNQLAHGLGLRTVAEGVEDADQVAQLRSMGVDVVQGYHVARPMPADHLVPWLFRRRDALAPLASA